MQSLAPSGLSWPAAQAPTRVARARSASTIARALPATLLLQMLVLAGVLLGLGVALRDVIASADRVSALTSLQVDAPAYDALAASLAAGAGWNTIPVRQPPGFVVVLAAVYAVAGHHLLAAKLLLWLALVASTALSAWLAARMWGAPAAWAAALLTATAPALRHYTGTVQYEVLVGAELLGALALLTAALATARVRAMVWYAAMAAVVAAGLVLTREVFAGVVPLFALWLAHQARQRLGAVRAAVLGTAFLAVALAPAAWWSAHQSARQHDLVLMTDKGAVTFALGNHPLASGTYDREHPVEPSGLRFVRERPAAALALCWRKALYFWGIIRDPWNVPRPAALWIYRASGGLVPLDVSLPLARGGWLLGAFALAVAVLLHSSAWQRWWIAPAVVSAVWAAHVVTLSSHRFAVPVLPVVFVLAAGPLSAGASLLAGWLSRAPWRMAGALTVSVMTVAFQWLAAAPPALAFAATDLDAMNATRVVDAATGLPRRLVAATDGPRPAMILSDEYLAAGRYQVQITAARGPDALDSDLAVARVSVSDAAGHVRCREDVPAGLVPAGAALGRVWVPCALPADGPATLVVEALGRADLTFGDVVFSRAANR